MTVLGGGGFRTPLLARAMHASAVPVTEMALYDVDPGRLEVMAAVLKDIADDITVALYTDPVQALDGSQLVFSAIRVGGTAERVRDERFALDHGVLGQETTGAGGLAYALRCVPECLRLARLVPDDAWLFSMTNPAGIVTEALRPVLGDRVVGVCDSPSGMVRRAEAALGIEPGSADPDYLGLNHLGWLRSLRVDGVDRLPELLHSPALLARTEEGRLFDPAFLAVLGSLPNEYLWYWYRAREAVDAVRRGPTRGEQVAVAQAEFYRRASGRPDQAASLWAAANDDRNASYLAESRSHTETRDATDVAAGGYETVAVALAEAVTGARPPTTVIANVPAPVAGLPTGSVIETVCTADIAGVAARPLPAPTSHQLGLMASVKASERAVIAAATATSPADAFAAAYEAFAVHPLVASLDVARELATDALQRAAQYEDGPAAGSR